MMIPHYLTLLAETAPQPDPLATILPWVTAFVAMVLAAVFKMQEKKATSMRLEEPVPVVPMRKVYNPVTWQDLQPILTRMDRLEKHLDEVRKEQSDQFKEILEAGSTREHRLTTHVDDVARAIHSRLDDVIRDNHQSKTPRSR